MIHWLLTLSRILIIPFLFSLVKKNDCKILYVTLYAIFSDFLDGYFARLLNKTSVIGAMLDGVADKLFIYALMIGLIMVNHMKLFALLSIWVIRDALLFVFWMLSRKSFESLFVGKAYTALQFFIVFIFLVSHVFNFAISKNIMLFLNILFIILGLISLKKYYEHLISC